MLQRTHQTQTQTQTQILTKKCSIFRKAGEDVAKDTPEEEIKLTKTFAAYMEDNQVKIQLLEIVFWKKYMEDNLFKRELLINNGEKMMKMAGAGDDDQQGEGKAEVGAGYAS